MNLRLLMLDDNAEDRFAFSRELRKIGAGVTVVEVQDETEFKAELDRGVPDAVVVDAAFPRYSGLDALQEIRLRGLDCPLILLTGSLDDEGQAEWLEKGFDRAIQKDRPAQLRSAVKRECLRREIERKRKEEDAKREMEALRDNRLEILGHLSVGITHDMNGVLQVFMMGTESLRDTKLEESQRNRVLDAMSTACARGTQMVKQLLEFGRGSNGAKQKPLAPDFILGEVSQIMRSGAFPNIQSSMLVYPGTPKALADPTQIHQVLLNLVTNARDALGSAGGEINFTAQLAHVDGRDFIRFSVRDNGPGIPEDVLPRIFTPFFTTKPRGQGTGFGLSIVKSIVTAHRGWVDVETGPSGTTFHIYLPVATEQTEHPKVQSKERFDGAGRTIVIADDEDFIRGVVAMLLEDAGYTVLQACNGLEAIGHFRSGKKIDLLLTDVVMSIMDGPALLAALRAQGIEVRVILFTGYDCGAVQDLAADGMLQKPFNREQLLRTIQRVLALDAPTAQAQPAAL